MTEQKLRVRHARAPSTATRGRHGKPRLSPETQESCGASRHSPLRPESIKLPRMNEEGCCLCPAAWRYVSAGALQVRSARVFARASWVRDNAARTDSASHARCQAASARPEFRSSALAASPPPLDAGQRSFPSSRMRR